MNSSKRQAYRSALNPIFIPREGLLLYLMELQGLNSLGVFSYDLDNLSGRLFSPVPSNQPNRSRKKTSHMRLAHPVLTTRSYTRQGRQLPFWTSNGWF